MNPKIKVCHVTLLQSHFDWRIMSECKALTEAGYDVHLVAPGAPDKKSLGAITTYATPKTPNGLYTVVNKVPRLLHPVLNQIQAELYHLHDPELLLFGAMLAGAGAKVIYDVREDLADQLLHQPELPKWQRRIYSWWFKSYEEKHVKKVNFIIAATPHLRERFHNMGCLCNDICDYPSVEETPLWNSDFSKRDSAVCYVGELAGRYGLFEMLGAIQEAQCKLLLAGKFLSPLEEQQARAHPGWALVEMVNPGDTAAVDQAMGRAMAGLVVFKRTGGLLNAEPIQFSSYMYRGLPVIASDSRMWREIIHTNRCGFCPDPDDPSDMAKCIRKILQDSGLAREFSANARKYALAHYKWENEVKKLLNVYQQVFTESEFVD